VYRIVEGYPKNVKKYCFWIWFRPRYKIPEFFTRAPVLTSTLTVCRRNRRDPSSLLRVRYKYYKNAVLLFWFGLEPPTRRSRSKLAHKIPSITVYALSSLYYSTDHCAINYCTTDRSYIRPLRMDPRTRVYPNTLTYFNFFIFYFFFGGGQHRSFGPCMLNRENGRRSRRGVA